MSVSIRPYTDSFDEAVCSIKNLTTTPYLIRHAHQGVWLEVFCSGNQHHGCRAETAELTLLAAIRTVGPPGSRGDFLPSEMQFPQASYA